MPPKSRTKPSNWKRKKGLGAPVKGRQLEATVHTSLPPLVKGSLRGHLVVSLEGGIVWEYSVGPPTPKLCVQLKWWGEKSPGTMFRVPVHISPGSQIQLGDCTSLAYFPIRSATSQLSAYLRDMGSLTLLVGLGHMTDSSMVIGQAIVPNIKHLSPSSPLKGRYPVVNSSGVCLGKLCVDIRIEINMQQGEEGSMHKQKKVTLAQPEFIVGPGTRFRERGAHESPPNSLSKDISTMVGVQNRVSGGPTLSTTKEIHIPTGDEETEKHMPERMELGTQQIEVISELIERGQQLRSRMVESIINQAASREEEKRLPETANEVNLFSARFTQQAGADIGADLIACGVDVNTSSEDDYDISGDVSLDESDYPLHNEALLSALYSLDHPESTGGGSDHLNHLHPTGGGVLPDKPETDDQMNLQEEEERRAKSGVDKDAHSIPAKTEPPKLSSKLSSQEQSVTTTAVPSVSQKGGENVQEMGRSDIVSNIGKSVTSSCGQMRKEKTDSLTTLSSYFVKGQSSLEAVIVSAIGLERLTQLGRVGSARITIDNLQIDPSFPQQILTHNRKKKKTGSNIPVSTNASKSPTYFVEYQFPAVSQQLPGSLRRPPKAHELMRVASRRMKNGVVKFSHHSVFPLEFNSAVIRHWWNSVLIFRVYCRPPTERMPFLVGKAVLSLKRLLTAKSPKSSHCHLEIKCSSLSEAVRERETDDAVVGTLEVSLEFVQSGRRSSPMRVGGVDEGRENMPGSKEEVHDGTGPSQMLGVSEAVVEGVAQEQGSPIRIREKDIIAKEVSEKPPALQLLLLIPEAVDVSFPSPPPSPSPSLPTGHSEKLLTPNCYLVCKLFCAKPHPHTPVQWASQNPQFSFKQLFPLYLMPALLNQVANNFTVVEVWHRTPGANTDDELIGLVKLSLHQFYLAFSDEESVHLCSQAELPVVAVDSYCPIVNPFSGHIAGHLAVLLALGTHTQICHLQQVYASGHYSLQLPHRPAARTRHIHQSDTVKPLVDGTLPALDGDDQQDGGTVDHVFVVCVEGVRQMTAFASTVWGEADCFVQYHFPSFGDGSGEQVEPEVSLHPCRTGTTLCLPNPSFSHETRHTLSLGCGQPVQKYIIAACGGGLGGAVPFELWRRFYYPNIRDQVVARASLPVAKLCALVTMRGAGSCCNVQHFPLPLKLLTDNKVATDGCGVLDVTVKYEAVHISDGNNDNSQHVNITVAILRAAGLKDAAGLVAPGNPVALGLAAEVGVNTYATISLPGITKEKRKTKTVAHSFSPEFSHLFDLTIPLSFCSAEAGGSTVTLAQKLAEGCLFVGLWHQPPKRSGSSLTGGWHGDTTGTGVVTGRRLAHGAKDVQLATAQVPLLQLLQKSTGIHGWYPLESTTPGVEEEGCGSECCFVGGVELSATFTNEQGRDLVMTNSLRQGWRAPDGLFIDLGGPPQAQLCSGYHVGSTEHAQRKQLPHFEEKNLRFEFSISHANLRLSAADIPTASQPTYKFCFIRYRFFDTKAVVTSPKAITSSRDGIATYQLNHRAQLHLTWSPQLQWYLSEESMEVQLWASLTKRRLSERPRPLAEDTLLGSAYVPLSDIISNERISGDFHLFKAGVDQLGGLSLHMELKRTVLSSKGSHSRPVDSLPQRDSCIEVLDASEDETDTAMAVREDKKKDDDGEENREMHEAGKLTAQNKEEQEEEEKGQEIVQDTFSARVVIHEALHLPVCRTEPRARDCEVFPSPYVTVHPHPNVERIVTAPVAGTRSPVWEHQSTTRVPNHYLQTQSQGLEFQVWSKTIEPQQENYVGSAHVDLCPLSFGLSHICGWYNIMDFSGQTQGQLKISIAPTQRISYPSPLLAYSTLTSVAGSFQSRLPSTSLVRGDSPLVLSTEQLLVTSAEDKINDFSTQTRSMLFQQLREDIQQLDGIHKGLLTRLGQWGTPCNLESLVTFSHHHQQLQEMTALRTSGSKPREESPPTAPPTLSFAGGVPSMSRTHSTHSAHPPTQHSDHNQHRVVETTPSKQNSPFFPHIDTHTQCELASTSVKEKSPLPDDLLSVHGSSEEDGNRLPCSEGSRTPLTADSSRSGSLTDVSTCSKGDSAILLNCTEKLSPLEQQMKTHALCQLDGDEQHSGDLESSLECSSSGKSPPPLQEEGAESVVARKSEMPTLPTHTSTTVSYYPLSHLTTTVSMPPAPQVKTTTFATTTATTITTTTPSPLHLSPNLIHQSTLQNEITHKPNQFIPLEHSSGKHSIKLPNYFMTPQQLEESMRSLRAGALSRAPPRACLDIPPETAPPQPVQCHRESVAAHLKTLQEVRAYLESRRTAERPQTREISASETQRLARIFSS